MAYCRERTSSHPERRTILRVGHPFDGDMDKRTLLVVGAAAARGEGSLLSSVDTGRGRGNREEEWILHGHG